MSPQRVYTIAELSREVGKPAHFLRDAIRRGFLACHQQCDGGRIHVTMDQWQDYLDGTLVVFKPSSGGGRQRRRARGTKSRRGEKATSTKSHRDPTSYRDLTF